METISFLCLHRCANGMWLDVEKVSELVEKKPEVGTALEFNEAKTMWRYITPGGCVQSKTWTAIGTFNGSDDKFIQLVFDPSDFEQLRRAFSFASHYYSSKD